MGKVWKRQWLRHKLEAAPAEEATDQKPAPAPEPIVEEKKVEKPKKTKKTSSKGYRLDKKSTAKKADK